MRDLHSQKHDGATRLIETLDRYDVSFVSVTQTFDASDSMGRLVLNILLTFAQFERELAGDRARDKKSALMRRGLFVGGTPPFGYTLAPGGRLVLDPDRAPIIRELFQRFPEVTASQLARELTARGCRSKRYVTKAGKERGGWPLYTNRILSILGNPIYTGHIVHRGDWIEAAFEPLVSREQWDLVQEVRLSRFPRRRDPVRNCLLGILHDEHGRRMKIQKGTGRARANRHYKSEHASWSRDGVTRRIMVDADRVEKLNRGKSMAELAKAKKLGPSRFARILRLNYLAPDIQAAIIDGTQPGHLTHYDILFGPMPLDWAQQRKILGFDTL